MSADQPTEEEKQVVLEAARAVAKREIEKENRAKEN